MQSAEYSCFVRVYRNIREVHSIKKIILLLLCALLLAACGPKAGEVFEGEVNNFDGVTMTVLYNTATPTGVTIQILNTTDKEIDSGNAYDFSLQVEQDDAWHLLESNPFANTADALIYPKDELIQQELDWSSRYGTLPAGSYRVVKEFSCRSAANDGIDDFCLAAPFTIE